MYPLAHYPQILHHLRQQMASDDGIGLEYIYCSYEETVKQTTVNFIANIVQQLFSPHQNLLLGEVTPVYERLRRIKLRSTFSDYVSLL